MAVKEAQAAEHCRKNAREWRMDRPHVVQTQTISAKCADGVRNRSNVTDSIAVKIEPESSAPVTPMPTPSMVTSASVTPFVSAAPSPAMRPTPTATPSPAEGSVERAARQEAEVLNRIAELRRQGLWSRKRLPMCVEPARSKTHWDYLLEEMRWMAMDFAQERRFKVNASRKFASTIARLARDKEQETMRADQRAIKEAKRVCALLAKMVREFWVNVDKVVDARAQGIIEAKKRKALDQHLDFIVGQADKFSSMVQEGMAGRVSTTPSLSRSPSVASKHDDENDKDFQAEEASDDDESTIAKAERKQKNVDEEVSALQKECDLELDDILDSLPADYFENRDRMIRPSSDDIRVFKQKRWEYFVLDEAQNIKNFKSQRWQLLLNMNAKRRLLLTGTPLQNSLMELWSLMHFLMPSIFASNRDFKDWFSNPLTGMIEGSQDYNAQLVQRLHKVLRPFILRRMKAQVEKQLPQKHEHIISCPLSKRQRYLYDDFMSRGSTKDNLRSGNVMSVLNIVMQLRKCCNHPNLFEPRPIVSPFAMQPIRRHLPSMLFDLVRPDPVDDFCVPQLFLLNGKSQIEHLSCKRLAADKTLIEEIDSSGDAKPPKLPSVAGFKFVRPVQMASIRSPEMGHANSRASANHGPLFKVNSEDIPSLGLSDSDANHFWLEVNGERKGRVPIQMQLPTNVLAKQNIAGAPVVKPQGRIFQLVTNSAGERTIHAIGEGGSSSPVKTGQILIRPAGSAAAGAAGGSATSSSATPFAPRITVVKVTTGSNLQAVIQSTTQTFSKTAKVQVRSAAGGQQPPQLVVQRVIGQQRVGTTLPYQLTARAATNLPVVNVAVRDEQPNSSNAPSMIRVRPLMSADRTPQTTAQGTPIVVMTPQTVDTTSTSAPATPQSAGDTKRPVVKRKMVPSPTERLSLPPNSNQNHPVILPNGQPPTTTPDVSRSKRPSLDHLALAETAERQLNWHKHNLRRLALENVRRLCNVVLPVVSSEAIALFTKWTDRSVPVDLTEELLEWTNSLVAKFVLYVHRAVTDAPLVDSTSEGRSAFCRFEDTLRSDVASRICSDSNALSTRVNSAKMLQFPELRLIEYDCGKLQALNQLLRRLKTGKHRCLIFTQMSKMLDVLEAFLCHHGYQYFRLDGATKIEQRQAAAISQDSTSAFHTPPAPSSSLEMKRSRGRPRKSVHFDQPVADADEAPLLVTQSAPPASRAGNGDARGRRRGLTIRTTFGTESGGESSKPTLGEYERPRLFFRSKRASLSAAESGAPTNP
uniref:Helicase domino n=1 Tax=Plectus sambesii TaxID=2011161 RepID=A0A914W4C5_9BILA